MMRRGLIILALIFGLPQASVAEPVPENAMKAAFVYNFALFTEWPAHTDVINVCIPSGDSLAYAFDGMEGKDVRGMRMSVTRLGANANVSNCQILYLGESDRSRVQDLLNRVGNAPILTVTDVDGLLEQGVMIGMFESNRRLAVEVNLEASKRAGLAISSKLLRLARRVY
jgi:hypothetical protein